MIIVSNKNMENSVYFERAIYTRGTDSYTVELVDRASNKTYKFEDLDDKRLVQYGFYTFFIDFTSCQEGEYEYSIKDSEGELVGKGLIRLNELQPDTKFYENKREYIVYDKQA